MIDLTSIFKGYQIIGILTIITSVLIFIFAIIIMFNSIKRRTKNAVNRTINNTIRKVTGDIIGANISANDIGQLINLAQEVSKEPEVKSVSDLTRIYLPKITKDFADFHNTEAIAAVKVFMNEYLDIKYREKTSFSNSNVDPSLKAMIDIAETKAATTDVSVHKVAICDYLKTNEYATIFYQVSVGYNLNGEKKEERYKIEYTMKLKENGVSEEIMKCDNCGAAIDSTEYEVCPYCDVRIIRDTRMSWKFTSITNS